MYIFLKLNKIIIIIIIIIILFFVCPWVEKYVYKYSDIMRAFPPGFKVNIALFFFHQQLLKDAISRYLQ